MTIPFTDARLPLGDALFEAVSAITTTGLSTLASVEHLPRTLLFARAWMQWYGGLGFVVLSLALLAGQGGITRRFIDPEATLVWLDKGEACPDEALGFAYAGARFDNSETRVAFEEMLARFDLAGNHALARIGAIVHSLEAQGTAVPEPAGVQTLLQGASRRSSSEDELLRECEKTFDLLYDAYYEAPAR